MSIKPLDLDEFISKASNVHEAIVAASKRARQANDDIRIEFNQRVEMVVTKMEAEIEENEVNPDQLKISLEFEKRPKPTEVALDELMAGEVEWRYKEPEEPIVSPSEDSE